MKAFLIAAAAVAVGAAPANAQGDGPAGGAAVERIFAHGEMLCRRMGLHLRANPDTVFSVENADRRGTPGFVVGPLECANTADPSQEPTRTEIMDRQYFVLGDGRDARMVWSGTSPRLSGVSGLRQMTPACNNGSGAENCPRVYWNGTTFTRQRPRATPARRRR